jgi:hypothetical protein
MKIKFLLHTCCAPCGIAIIDELKNKFDLMVFFYNPNIFPQEEYLKRKKYVIQVCDEWQVPFVDMDYDAQLWHNKVAKGLEQEAEGGVRCELCFKFRLAKTFDYAAQNNFKYVGTSLSMGRNKKAEVINFLGASLAKHYKMRFYDVDWKKDGRQEKGQKMVVERGIYRQKYCGCAYSRSEKLIVNSEK